MALFQVRIDSNHWVFGAGLQAKQLGQRPKARDANQLLRAGQPHHLAEAVRWQPAIGGKNLRYNKCLVSSARSGLLLQLCPLHHFYSLALSW